MSTPACRLVDPDLMYPEDDDLAGIHQARQVCRDCPLQDECLQRALDLREDHGVWGGLPTAERRRLHAGVPVKECSDCRLRFVPRLTGQYRCTRCATTEHSRPGTRPHGTPLDRDQVAKLAADGKSDGQIGMLLGVTPKRVFLARRRWGIAAGVRRAWLVRPSGSANGRTQLTEGQVVDIREVFAAGDATSAELAIRYGLTPSAVNDILRGRAWATAGGPLCASDRRGDHLRGTSRPKAHGKAA